MDWTGQQMDMFYKDRQLDRSADGQISRVNRFSSEQVKKLTGQQMKAGCMSERTSGWTNKELRITIIQDT